MSDKKQDIKTDCIVFTTNSSRPTSFLEGESLLSLDEVISKRLTEGYEVQKPLVGTVRMFDYADYQSSNGAVHINWTLTKSPDAKVKYKEQITLVYSYHNLFKVQERISKLLKTGYVQIGDVIEIPYYEWDSVIKNWGKSYKLMYIFRLPVSTE